MKKKFFIYLIAIFVTSFALNIGAFNYNKNSNFLLRGYDDFYYVVDREGTSLTFNLKDSVENENQLSNYFFNLKENIPYNQANSCGYVAQALVLGYYDTYFNDNIVSDDLISKVNLTSTEEIYQNSPGHNNDFFQVSNKYTQFEDYFNFVKNNPNKSLHFNLISKARNLEIVPNNYSNSVKSYSLSFEQLKLICDEYLEDNNVKDLFLNIYNENVSTLNFNYRQGFTDEAYSNSDILETEIVELVAKGVPVIVGIGYYDENNGEAAGHAVVAYDYVITRNFTTKILVHTGYHNEPCVELGGDYCITGYNAIIPVSYTNHVCSSNYIINNQGCCPCKFANHEHRFVRYTSKNSTKHFKICYCGYSTQENHTMSTNLNGDYCTLCGYIASGNNFIYQKNNEEVS